MASEELSIFAQRLRQVREERGFSQANLASLAGLQPAAVSHFETGKRSPSFANLRRLADVLNASIDFLLGRSEERTTAGPRAAALYRDAEKITGRDLEVLENLAKMMVDRQEREGKSNEQGDQAQRCERGQSKTSSTNTGSEQEALV